jgi:predicted ATPase/class 3 adenylate cyclase
VQLAELPTGTLTFLFTDIEGSTRLWENAPEAMKVAIARHTELVVTNVDANGGIVVRSRGEGDSTFSVFQDAADAVRAACSLQRSLSNEAWPDGAAIRVRAALHTGTGEIFGRDYNSSDVNRCARLRAIASGDQTLLTKATYDRVIHSVSGGIGFKDLGPHRLKDLNRAEHVYQLTHPDLRESFPPLQSLDSFPNNLPPQITSFIGREAEIKEVTELLSTTRLLTIMGSGGCGKTRLSLQVAAQVLEQFPDGVWFIELAPLTDPNLVPQVVGHTLAIREEPGKTMIQSLCAYLEARSALLVFDNCEHVVASCAELAHEFLSRCGKITMLASSREALRVYGETTWRLPSLSLPDNYEHSRARTLESTNESTNLLKFEAINLFVERARAVLPGFMLTNQNAADVAHICRTLDGIPLALELAAARVKVLTVDKIASRLEDRFRLLTDGNRTAPTRQQTLRALIDWSYDLLTDRERLLLARLSVFAGGWDLEAAEAVCDSVEVEKYGGEDLHTSAPPHFHIDILDMLSQLVDKSLVIVDERPGGVGRYRLLETLRQYGRDKLSGLGEEAAVLSRHSEYYSGIANKAAPHLISSDQIEWLGLLETEHDNLRSVLDRCRGSSATAGLGLALATDLWRFWFIRGYFGEGRDWLRSFLTLSENAERSIGRGRALTGEGRLAICLGDGESAALSLAEALSIQTAHDDRLGASVSYMSLGVMSAMNQDFPEAKRAFERGLVIQREIGDKRGTAISLSNLANVAIYQGDLPGARELLDESLVLSTEISDTQAIATALNNLGHVAAKQADYIAARSYFTSSLALCKQLGYKSGIADCTEELAKLAAELQEAERASVLFAVAGNLRETLNLPLPPVEQAVCERHLAVVREILPKETFESSWSEGAGMSIDEAVAYALGDASPVDAGAAVP